MKKILLVLSIITTVVLGAVASDKYVHNDSVLPQAAKTVLSKNFNAKVSIVKVEKDFGRVDEYEVILTDGTEISFDRQGNWKDVETPANRHVPDFFIEKSIRDYVSKNHSGQRIIGVERKRSGFDIELSNGIDMKFDKQGQFIRFD